MSQVSQTAQGQNPKFSCGSPLAPLTGTKVLDSLPESFVDQQVHFVATASVLQEDLGGGSSDADLLAYYDRHRAEFDTACFTGAAYSSQSAAERGGGLGALRHALRAGGRQRHPARDVPCGVPAEVGRGLAPSAGSLNGLTAGKVSDPIDVQGNYLLLQLLSRTPTSFDKAKPVVTQVVEMRGHRWRRRRSRRPSVTPRSKSTRATAPGSR